MGIGSWTIGVLAAGSENAQRVAGGKEDTEQAAIETTSDAAAVSSTIAAVRSTGSQWPAPR